MYGGESQMIAVSTKYMFDLPLFCERRCGTGDMLV